LQGLATLTPEQVQLLPAKIQHCILNREQLIDKVVAACAVYELAFTQFAAENIAISFNGGKDCTVVMYLLQMWCQFVDAVHQNPTSTFKKIKFIHFVKANEFVEISEFRSRVEQT
jgi:3'-phosphoadenosine 5'-phosphosulfate sulfotransferase (PAPS reductase)/FAD synthetase